MTITVCLLEVTIAQHQRDPGPRCVGRPHGRLESASAVGPVDPDARRAQPAGDDGQLPRCRLAERNAVDLASSRVADRDAFGRRGQHGPVHTEPETDAGQRLSAQLGHQSVVSAAAAHAGLGAEPGVDEFEGGTGVVVQAANHPGVDHVRHLEPVEDGQHFVEVRP